MIRRDDVDEVQIFAEEAGAQTIRGILRYPDENGGYSVGEKDLEELLWDLRGHEILLVVASLGEKKVPVLCGLCGSHYEDSGCPTCQREAAEAREFMEWQRTLFEEIEEFLKGK